MDTLNYTMRLAMVLITSLSTAVRVPAPHNAEVPEKPLPPEVISVSSTSVVLRWTSPPDNGEPIQGFALYGGVAAAQCATPLYDPDLVGGLDEPDRRNLTVRGLQPDTQHVFCMFAWNRAGRSSSSELTRARTGPVDVIISAVVPPAGPMRGGTRLRVSGSDFALGPAVYNTTVFKCRLGSEIVPGTLTRGVPPLRAPSPDGAVVWPASRGDPASVHSPNGDAGAADGGLIECLTPATPTPRALRPSGELITPSSFAVPVYISLDGTATCPLYRLRAR